MGGLQGRRRRPPGLAAVVEALRERDGVPEWPPTSDPFELVLLENVAYLASPRRRHAAFAHLKETVGTSPEAILAAPPRALREVTAHGILKAEFAGKLVTCARLTQERFSGDLAAALPEASAAAARALRAYPGIGEPGAEKILLFSGRAARLAPESNGLRVLVRLGLVKDEGPYARTWAAARDLGAALGDDVRAVQEAHLLLKRHGEVTCRRSRPRCAECALRRLCPSAE